MRYSLVPQWKFIIGSSSASLNGTGEYIDTQSLESEGNEVISGLKRVCVVQCKVRDIHIHIYAQDKAKIGEK